MERLKRPDMRIDDPELAYEMAVAGNKDRISATYWRRAARRVGDSYLRIPAEQKQVVIAEKNAEKAEYEAMVTEVNRRYLAG